MKDENEMTNVIDQLDEQKAKDMVLFMNSQETHALINILLKKKIMSKKEFEAQVNAQRKEVEKTSKKYEKKQNEREKEFKKERASYIG